MPYIKTLPNNLKETYTIGSVSIDVDGKRVSGQLQHVSYDSDRLPVVDNLRFSIANQDTQIIDPEWGATSDPPKPDDFNELNPDTWGELTRDQIPYVTDDTKQYFDIMIKKQGTRNTNIYERIKTILYTTLAELEQIPGGDEWSID